MEADSRRRRSTSAAAQPNPTRTILQDTISLRILLNRLKKDELLECLYSWDWALPDEIANSSRPVILRYLYSSLLAQGLSLKQIADIDLKHKQRTGLKRLWHTFSFTPFGDKEEKQECLERDKIQAILRRELDSYFRNYTVVVLHEYAYWIRIAVYDNLQLETDFPPSTNIGYLVYHPHSHIIFSSNMKKQYVPFIRQSLLNAFNFKSMDYTSLSAKNIYNLTEIGLMPPVHGKYKKLLDLSFSHPNPLDSSNKRRRTNTKHNSKDQDKQVDEVVAERDKIIEEHFGEGQEIPLEKIQFKIDDDFRGNERIFQGRLSFTVRFEGKNVMEGVKQFVRQGILEPPFPTLFKKVHTENQTTFEIVQPTNPP